MSASKRPEYSFRFFNGRTVRHYEVTTGLCRKGDHVVMDGRFERALFHNAQAAEVFCNDFSADWILAPGIVVSAACPICSRVAIGEASSPNSAVKIRVCRECGYHTNLPTDGTTQGTAQA